MNTIMKRKVVELTSSVSPMHFCVGIAETNHWGRRHQTEISDFELELPVTNLSKTSAMHLR